MLDPANPLFRFTAFCDNLKIVNAFANTDLKLVRIDDPGKTLRGPLPTRCFSQ